MEDGDDAGLRDARQAYGRRMNLKRVPSQAFFDLVSSLPGRDMRELWNKAKSLAQRAAIAPITSNIANDNTAVDVNATIRGEDLNADDSDGRESVILSDAFQDTLVGRSPTGTYDKEPVLVTVTTLEGHSMEASPTAAFSHSKRLEESSISSGNESSVEGEANNYTSVQEHTCQQDLYQHTSNSDSGPNETLAIVISTPVEVAVEIASTLADGESDTHISHTDSNNAGFSKSGDSETATETEAQKKSMKKEMKKRGGKCGTPAPFEVVADLKKPVHHVIREIVGYLGQYDVSQPEFLPKVDVLIAFASTGHRRQEPLFVPEEDSLLSTIVALACSIERSEADLTLYFYEQCVKRMSLVMLYVQLCSENSKKTKNGNGTIEQSLIKMWDAYLKHTQFGQGDSTGRRREQFRLLVSQGRVLCLLALAATYNIIFLICCRPGLMQYFIGTAMMPNDTVYELAVCLRLAGRMEKQTEPPYQASRMRQGKVNSKQPHLESIFDQFILPAIALLHRKAADSVQIPTYGLIQGNPWVKTCDFKRLSQFLKPPLKGWLRLPEVHKKVQWPYGFSGYAISSSVPSPLTPASQAEMIDVDDILVLTTNFSHEEMRKVPSICDNNEGDHAHFTESLRRAVAETCTDLQGFTTRVVEEQEEDGLDFESRTSFESEEPMDVVFETESTVPDVREKNRKRNRNAGARPATNRVLGGIQSSTSQQDGQRTRKRHRTCDGTDEFKSASYVSVEESIQQLENHIQGITIEKPEKRSKTWHYQHGATRYVHWQPDKVNKKILRVQDQSGKDVLTYMSDGPEDLVRQYSAGASNVLGDRIKEMDSREKGHEFDALHCSVIYRYADKITHDKLPQETDEGSVMPTHLKRGTDGRQVNYLTLVPYWFKEVWDSLPFFLALHFQLHLYFLWITARLKKLDPKTFKMLSTAVRPLGDFVPLVGGLLGGFVCNSNCATRAHRDKLDMGLCICFTFGDWVGGHLVIDELGLVFDLKPGDVIIFDSTILTHYNMHFVGRRTSIVLHSDKYLKAADSLIHDLRKLNMAM